MAQVNGMAFGDNTPVVINYLPLQHKIMSPAIFMAGGFQASEMRGLAKRWRAPRR